MLVKPRLLTPGPTPLLPEGLSAQSLATVHHRTPAFKALFNSAREGLRRFYRLAPGEEVVILSGSGTAALEAALVNACAPGDTDSLDTLMVIGTLETAFQAFGVKIAKPGGEAAQAVLAGSLK